MKRPLASSSFHAQRVAQQVVSLGSLHKITMEKYRAQVHETETLHKEEVTAVIGDSREYRLSLKEEAASAAERHTMALEDINEQHNLSTIGVLRWSAELLERHMMDAEDVTMRRLLKKESMMLQTQEEIEASIMHREDISMHLHVRNQLALERLAEDAERHKMAQEDRAAKLLQAHCEVRARTREIAERYRMAMEDASHRLLTAAAFVRQSNATRAEHHATELDRSVVRISAERKEVEQQNQQEIARHGSQASHAAVRLAELSEEERSRDSTLLSEHQAEVDSSSRALSTQSVRANEESREGIEIKMMALEDFLNQAFYEATQARELSKESESALRELRERELMDNENRFLRLVLHHHDLRALHDNAADMERQKLEQLHLEHSEAVERYVLFLEKSF